MSYQEKRTIVSIISGLFVLGFYCFYTSSNYRAGVLVADDIRGWASTMLVFIGIGIVATIIIQIGFHVLLCIAIAAKQKILYGKCDDREIDRIIDCETVTDEMDKLIELKSLRIGTIVIGIGFATSLVSIVLHYPMVVMINILFISFLIGSLFEGCTQLYFYRRGIRNG